MSEETRYNGWANYETWAMKLWIDNDEGSYNYARELAEEARAEGENRPEWSSEAEHIRFTLADLLKEWQEELLESWSDGLPTCQFSDLLNAAFSEIDWQEIADNLLSEWGH